MREWVVGFALDDVDRVVLIEKSKPPWMAGMLNGVGGKMEGDETPVEAMTREFYEETGVLIQAWHPFVRMVAVSTEDGTGTVTSDAGVVWFLRALVNDATLEQVRTAEDKGENVMIHSVSTFLEGAWGRLVPNLHWLIPLARHVHDTYEVIEVHERTTTLRVNASA